MRKILFIMLTLLGVFCNVHSQIYNSGICYYIKAGSDLNSSSKIYIAKFSGERVVCWSYTKSEVTTKLRESPSYWENKLNKALQDPSNCFKYNSSLSTSSKEVYSRIWKGEARYVQTGTFSWEWRSQTLGYTYKAFSMDTKSMIAWDEDKSGDIKDKTYWIKIDVSELSPQAKNYDFLYE